jgi:hypothetical protein
MLVLGAGKLPLDFDYPTVLAVGSFLFGFGILIEYQIIAFGVGAMQL